MKKVNQWFTLLAHLAVVAGIAFLAAELRQKPRAIQAQPRDSITEKQMEFYGWLATSAEWAAAWSRAQTARFSELDSVERALFNPFFQGVYQEGENFHGQFDRGLFTPEEFTARVSRLKALLESATAAREVWRSRGDSCSETFIQEVDDIVAGVEDRMGLEDE